VNKRRCRLGKWRFRAPRMRINAGSHTEVGTKVLTTDAELRCKGVQAPVSISSEHGPKALKCREKDSVAGHVADEEHAAAAKEALHAVSCSCTHQLVGNCRLAPPRQPRTTPARRTRRVRCLQPHLPDFQRSVEECEQHPAAAPCAEDLGGSQRIYVSRGDCRSQHMVGCEKDCAIRKRNEKGRERALPQRHHAFSSHCARIVLLSVA